MKPLHTVAQIRTAEHAAQAALPPGTLMQRAGEAAAQLALQLAAAPARVLVLAGPGNNGGDALDAAARLASAGLEVTVALFAEAGAMLPPDAHDALQRARSGKATFIDAHAGMSALLQRDWQLVIDGLLGIGLARPIGGAMRVMVEFVNTLSCPLLALDVPSGLDADTGDIIGPDGVAVRASHTITFIADKPGLHTCHGRDHAGAVSVAALGIDASLLPQAQAWRNEPAMFAAALQPRRHNSHKGSFGDVAVLGGANGMQGAPMLSARAALHCGAGRVFACFVDDAPACDPVQPELMCRPAADVDFSRGVTVAGPGAGDSARLRNLLETVLEAATSLVLDADALNLIAADDGLQRLLAARGGQILMTPHPLEAARLLAVSPGMVQADRLAAARQLAERFNAVVVLKGSGSIVARPDGCVAVNTSGNPALATAGSGDVLAGACGALLAQGLPAWEAALAAVWLHGHAADTLVQNGVGPIGVTAGELIPALRAAFNRAVSDRAPDRR